MMSRSPPALLSPLCVGAGLFYTSLGSLGEAAVVCRRGNEGGSLSLTCPSGVIGQVQAYYGQPQGVCDCPGDQQIQR